MLDRIQRLEAAVFSQANRDLELDSADPHLDGVHMGHTVCNCIAPPSHSTRY